MFNSFRIKFKVIESSMTLDLVETLLYNYGSKSRPLCLSQSVSAARAPRGSSRFDEGREHGLGDVGGVAAVLALAVDR